MGQQSLAQFGVACEAVLPESFVEPTEESPTNRIEWGAVNSFIDECVGKQRNYGWMCLRVLANGITQSSEIKRPFKSEDDSYGGMSSSGGFYGCAKHVDEQIESFKRHCGDGECGIFWSEDAKKLYVQMKETNSYIPCTEMSPEEALSRLEENEHLFSIGGLGLYGNQTFDDCVFALKKKYSDAAIECMLSELRAKALVKLRNSAFSSVIYEMGGLYDHIGREDFAEQIVEAKRERDKYIEYCKMTDIKPRDFFFIEDFEKIHASLRPWHMLWATEKEEAKKKILEAVEKQMKSLGLTKNVDLYCGLYGWYFDVNAGRLMGDFD